MHPLKSPNLPLYVKIQTFIGMVTTILEQVPFCLSFMECITFYAIKISQAIFFFFFHFSLPCKVVFELLAENNLKHRNLYIIFNESPQITKI